MRSVFLVFLLLAACAPRTEPYKTAPLPDTDGYLSAVPAGHTAYDNEGLSGIFLNLTYFNEGGSAHHGLSRFEGPVTVQMQGPGSAAYSGFLDMLLEQIRGETGIDISRGQGPNSILVTFVPGEEFLPYTTNQCFILFGQPTWREFLKEPRKYYDLGRAAKGVLTKAGVFIPDTIEPFKVRQCLVEEIVQMLGTSNDLFGLGPTMFNDDQAHYWPTKLDYLMLRVLYAPEIEPGMAPVAARAVARAVLDRINPEGHDAPALPPPRLHEFAGWRRDVFRLADSDNPAEDPVALARKLAQDAARRRPNSPFDCAGKVLYANHADKNDDDQARALYETAIDTCSGVHGKADIRIADLRLRIAWLDMNDGKHRRARDEARALAPIFIAHGQDDGIMSSKTLEVVAARAMSDPNWDGALLSTAEAWSAYAMGDDHDITESFRR